MLRTRAVTLALLLLVTVLAPLTAVSTGPPDGNVGDPACDPGDVADNEDVRIWFHGKKGKLKVYKKNQSTDGIDGMYQYKQLGVTELDADNDTVATLNLEDAQPLSSTCTVEREGDWVNVTYNVTDTVRTVADDGPDDETAQVGFTYHFNTNSSEAKFDLAVREWPWHADGDLAYDFEVTSEQWVIEEAENGLGFKDNDTGEREAFIQWAPNATAKYEDGHEEEAVVNSTVEGGDHHVTVDLQFTQASAGYEELLYDPTVAVGPYLIVGDLLVAVPKPVERLQAAVGTGP